MIKYLVPLAGLLFLLVVVSAQQDGEKSDLEASEFLFRPVYIRYGYHPHNSYGWKGVQQHGGWQPHGYGWGSYHLHGWDKKGGKKHKKAKKKAQKKKKKAYKKKSKKGGWGWPGGQGGGGGYGGGGYGGGGYGGGGWGWGGGGYGGFEE